MALETGSDRRRWPSRKAITVSAWGARYEEMALTGVRSREVTERIALHLRRFGEYLSATYGHERLSSVVRRDVVGWRDMLVSSGLGPSTINNHLASLSGFCGWVVVRAPDALPGGDPTSGVRTLALAPLEPRALTPAQVRSLKSVVDRLERFHARKGRRAAGGGERHSHSRPRGRMAIHSQILNCSASEVAAAMSRLLMEPTSSSSRCSICALIEARPDGRFDQRVLAESPSVGSPRGAALAQ